MADRELGLRKDISKVICERERHGSSRSYRYIRNERVDSQKIGFSVWPFEGESLSPHPFKEGMKKRFGKKFGYKSLSDFLSPIRGFLTSSVGRKWDDIYSDLSKNIPKSKFLNQHVWEHIFDYVEIHTAWIDGEVCVSDDIERKYVPLTGHYRWGWKRDHQFYVHPVSRILLKVDYTKIREERKKRDKDFARDAWNHCRELRRTKTSVFHAVKMKSVWYEVEVRVRPPKEKRFYFNQDGTKTLDSNGEPKFYWENPRVREEYLDKPKHAPHTSSATYIALKRT